MEKTIKFIQKPIVLFFLILIKLYRSILSPFLGYRCRFYPTCSHYAEEAIQQHGIYGVYLTIRRLLRCHPFNQGGIDPVPEKRSYLL